MSPYRSRLMAWAKNADIKGWRRLTIEELLDAPSRGQRARELLRRLPKV